MFLFQIDKFYKRAVLIGARLEIQERR